MTTAWLSLLYTAACAVVFLSAFSALVLSFRHQARKGDRTGLKTTHPELLDENGFITKEELLVVRFGGHDGNAFTASAQG